VFLGGSIRGGGRATSSGVGCWISGSHRRRVSLDLMVLGFDWDVLGSISLLTFRDTPFPMWIVW
jgi:hypothetical protein